MYAAYVYAAYQDYVAKEYKGYAYVHGIQSGSAAYLVPNAMIPPCTCTFQPETKVQGGWVRVDQGVDYLLLITKSLSD